MRAVLRAAIGAASVLGPSAAFVLGGPVNLAGALVLSAMFYPAATWLLGPTA